MERNGEVSFALSYMPDRVRLVNIPVFVLLGVAEFVDRQVCQIRVVFVYYRLAIIIKVRKRCEVSVTINQRILPFITHI